jgi:hypothetical protein
MGMGLLSLTVILSVNKPTVQPGAVHLIAAKDPDFQAQAVHDCPHPFAEQVLVLYQQVSPESSE